MSDSKLGLNGFNDALGDLIKAAKEDNGKSYDELAERIRQRSADGLIEEALGYVPDELQTRSTEDPYRPLKHMGRSGKRKTKEQDLPAPVVEKFHP